MRPYWSGMCAHPISWCPYKKGGLGLHTGRTPCEDKEIGVMLLQVKGGQRLPVATRSWGGGLGCVAHIFLTEGTSLLRTRLRMSSLQNRETINLCKVIWCAALGYSSPKKIICQIILVCGHSFWTGPLSLPYIKTGKSLNSDYKD